MTRCAECGADTADGAVRCVLAFALAVLLVGCREPALATCAVDDPAGPVVRITATEVEAAPRWELEEIWRARGLDEGSQLTLPTATRAGPDGRLAIADFGTGEVRLIDADGGWAGSLAGTGQGPGELMNPLMAAWTPEGDILALDAVQSKIERYSPRGEPVETLAIPPDLLGPVVASGEVGWFALRSDGEAFVELPPVAAPDRRRRIEFARGGAGDEERRTIWSTEYRPEATPTYTRHTLPEWPRAVLAAGGARWAVAPRSDRYEFIVHGPSDEPELHVCVADSERYGRGSGAGPDTPDELVDQLDRLAKSETEALFSRAHLDTDGRLWVQRELARPGTLDALYGVPGAHFDVLSVEGRLLAKLKLPDGIRLQDARGDTVWAFALGEFDEVDVVALEIRRPGG